MNSPQPWPTGDEIEAGLAGIKGARDVIKALRIIRAEFGDDVTLCPPVEGDNMSHP